MYCSKLLSLSGRGVWGEGVFLMEMRNAIEFKPPIWKAGTQGHSLKFQVHQGAVQVHSQGPKSVGLIY